MKILYVITQSDSIGGASLHLLDLAAGVQADGHEVELCAGGHGQLADYAARRGIAYRELTHLVREIAPVSDTRAVFELARHLRHVKPDLIHLHSSKAGIVGRLAARLAGVPSVFTAHGWAFTEGVSPRQRQMYRLIEKCCAPLCQHIITVSEYDRRLAETQGVIDSQKMSTIHNGVPDTPLRVTKEGNQADVRLRIIMVARFQRPKDQALLIRAVATLQAPWVLELVGDGPDLAEAKALVSTLGLSERVHFPGACDDIPARLAASDVFVLTSAWEGLPLSIIEAMRAGLPVIASDVGGVGELVIPEETGLLIERGNQSGLSDALKRFSEDAGLRQQMGQAGRRRYEQEFAFEPMLRRTLNVYEQVLSKRQKKLDPAH